jgi:hypothetical protein
LLVAPVNFADAEALALTRFAELIEAVRSISNGPANTAVPLGTHKRRG